MLRVCDKVVGNDEFFSPCGERGSSSFAGMAVVPCSMGNSPENSERHRRITCRGAPRIMPQGTPPPSSSFPVKCLTMRDSPLKICSRLTHAGRSVIPASPHFYNHPQTIDELADITVVAKVLTHLRRRSRTLRNGTEK